MGSGASTTTNEEGKITIEQANEEAIINQLKEVYKNNPKQMQRLWEQISKDGGGSGETKPEMTAKKEASNNVNNEKATENTSTTTATENIENVNNNNNNSNEKVTNKAVAEENTKKKIHLLIIVIVLVLHLLMTLKAIIIQTVLTLK